ncbi:glycosyl transferase family 1 [Dictyobacter alpinus]|uniref:Glycosyl transferase family 1 n=1 Tax=Dictyobacter alpinus TaxID=2014873 RepID=A0A402BI13_9CHLR|nr:glycosyltransferase [Dictyobacter alpinus]GCE30882.1 glycosyl transferase family 1 [Dictyobacter alpinus]
MRRSAQLDQYSAYIGEDVLTTIYNKADKLRGIHVSHINTTAHGGGVAEILAELEPLVRDFDIKHTRKIIQLDEKAHDFTSSLIGLLQGGQSGDISATDRDNFVDWLGQARLSEHDDAADAYIVHDYQLVPLAQLYDWMKPAAWFCHVDTAHPNPHALNYVKSFLDAYQLAIFNTELSVFPDLPTNFSQVMILGIDPFQRKHAPLEHAQGVKILQQCGIDVHRPLITQVSRFDPWKNPKQVIDVYRLVKQQLPEVQLAFVGAMTATDDTGAVDVLHDLQHYADGDTDIHFLSDPAIVGDDQVNAFQRYSSVILQRSLREGFGLTATEAMWKNQPVVGTSATGLRTQLVDGQNGYIVDDTATCAERTLELLLKRDLWQRLGTNAHEHVRTHYLLPMMLLSYLDALEKIYLTPSQQTGIESQVTVSDIDPENTASLAD